VKKALITGASSGIGREFAVQLAAQGYAITAVARRAALLETLVAELPGEGHGFIVADLARTQDLERVAGCLQHTQYQLLVNNAGYSTFEPFYAGQLQSQKDMLAVNCGAVVHLAHAFLGQARAGDALINLASVVSFLPTPAQPMYSASKAFIASLSKCLWEEQRRRNVYVMGLCPGITQTEFIATATGGQADGGSLPAALTQSAAQVVAEALRALGKRRQALVVTGRANRLMVALMPRLLSQQGLLRLLALVGDPEKAL